jgi:O-antigen ligase
MKDRNIIVSIDVQKPIPEDQGIYSKWRLSYVKSYVLRFFTMYGGLMLLGGLLGAVVLKFHYWSLVFFLLFLVSLFFISRPFYAVLLFVWVLPDITEADVVPYLHYNVWFYPLTILIIGWSGKLLTQTREIFVSKKYLIAYVGFLIACLFSWQFGADISIFLPSGDPLIVKLFTDPRYRMLWEPILTAILMFPVMSAIKTSRQLSWIFWGIIISGIFYTSTLFFTGFSIDTGLELIARSKGIFTTPLHAGRYILIPMIMTASLIYKETSYIKRFCLIIFLFVFLLGEYRAASKSAFIALFLVVICAILLEMNLSKIIRYGFLATIGIIIGLFFLPILSGKAYHFVRTTILNFTISNITMKTSAVVGPTSSVGGRLILIQAGLKIFKKYPLFGAGLGKHHWLLSSIGGLPKSFINRWGHIHTNYIIILAEIGIVGFSFYILIIGFALYDLFRAFFYFKRSEDRQMYHLSQGVLLSFIGVLLCYWGTTPSRTELAFWLLIGLAAAIGRMTDQEQKQGEILIHAE